MYKFSGDPDTISYATQPVERYSGGTDIVAAVKVSGYFDAIAVAFEQAEGRPPAPFDSQQFELTVRPMPDVSAVRQFCASSAVGG